MKERIIAASGSPRELEVLYRRDPQAFRDALAGAIAESPGSVLLRAWQERLFFDSDSSVVAPTTTKDWHARDVVLVLLLTLAAGLAEKLPMFFPALSEDRFYPRNLALIPLAALILYFCAERELSPRRALPFLAAVAIAFVFINLLPEVKDSATLILACIHLPCFLWSMLGLAYVGGDWKNRERRIDYIRYNGELVIYSAILLLGGMVLTGVTIGLFSLIKLQIHEWYMRNIVIYGTVAAPLVASLLIEKVVGAKLKVAPIVARIFIPLFFLSILVFLFVLAATRESPFTDRDSLLTYNLLLLLILALCLLSVSSRPLNEEGRFFRYLNLALMIVTLAVDLVALTAVAVRFSWFGFSINRFAVLAGNLLVLVHLGGSAFQYWRYIRNQQAAGAVTKWMFGYLPVYTAWTILIGFLFPLIFGFR